jgi:hypothetical protein
LSTHLRLGLSSGLFPSGFPTNILYAFIVFPIRTTCPAYLILLDLIQVRGFFRIFLTSLFLTVKSYPHAQPPSWRTTPCLLSATAYSMYSQLPSKTGDRLLHPQPEDAPCLGDKGLT